MEPSYAQPENVLASVASGSPAPVSALLSELDAWVDYVKDYVDSLAPSTVPIESDAATWDINLVYGELKPRGIHQMLEAVIPFCKLLSTQASLADGSEHVSPSKVRVPRAFWDLGSGEGVPCLVAALAFDVFDECVGVELLPRLHALAGRHMRAACAVLGVRLEGEGEDEAARVLRSLVHQPPPVKAWACTRTPQERACGDGLAGIDLRCDDFLTSDWSAAAIVFCNGTCYQDDVLRPLFKKAESLRPGAIFIITSQTVSSPLFTLVWEGVLPASWGTATGRAYRRNERPKWMGSIRTGGASPR